MPSVVRCGSAIVWCVCLNISVRRSVGCARWHAGYASCLVVIPCWRKLPRACKSAPRNWPGSVYTGSWLLSMAWMKRDGASNGKPWSLCQGGCEMDLSSEEVMMLRLVKEATAQGLVVAQDYQTREVMLLAPTGEMHI